MNAVYEGNVRPTPKQVDALIAEYAAAQSKAQALEDARKELEALGGTQ